MSRQYSRLIAALLPLAVLSGGCMGSAEYRARHSFESFAPSMVSWYFPGSFFEVKQLAYMRDGTLVTGNRYGELRGWDDRTGRELWRASVPTGDPGCRALVGLRDESAVLIGGESADIWKVQQLASGVVTSKVATAPEPTVRLLAERALGPAILAVGWKGIALIPSAGGQAIQLPGCAAKILDVAVSPDGQTILAGDGDGALWRWDNNVLTARFPVETNEFNNRVPIAISWRDRHAYVTSFRRGFVVYDFDTGAEIRAFARGPTTPLLTAIDDDYLVAVCNDARLRVWRFADGVEVACTPLQPRAVPTCMAIDPARKRIAFATAAEEWPRLWVWEWGKDAINK